MKRLLFTAAGLLLSSATVWAQGAFEGGIKGGATFTHGYTTIPAIPVSASISIPQLNNKNNGIGYGYSFGLWGRQNFKKFYIQVEVDYNDFLLKQKTNLSVPAGLAFAIVGQQIPAQIPAQTPTAVNITSESTLQSVNVPILFGKKWANGKVRAFIGPNLLFTTKAQVSRNISASIGPSTITVPATTTDLKNLNSQSPTETILAVKDFTYAAEVGVGYTFLQRLDLDVRYAAPVGGIYKSKDITGYLGIATVSLGLRLF